MVRMMPYLALALSGNASYGMKQLKQDKKIQEILIAFPLFSQLDGEQQSIEGLLRILPSLKSIR
jgi:hypothetical protein